MAILNIDGFKLFDKGINSLALIVESYRIEECMSFFKERDIKEIVINRVHGYHLDNVDFLENFPEIEFISISEGISNMEGIYNLKKLKKLMLGGERSKIDFLNFPLLEQLIIDWSPCFLNLQSCLKLKDVSIFKYKPSSKNFKELSNIFWLEKISISQSNIESFEGLAVFNQLHELNISYCPKLVNLGSLEASVNSLSVLLMAKCKSVKNFDYVGKLKKLKVLAFNDCGSISTISFIKEIPDLESFSFVNTNIVDGDLSPCIGLKYVGFFDKKHYSHKYEQVNPGLSY